MDINYNDFDEVFKRFCEISGDNHACDCRGCEFEYSENCKDIKNMDYISKAVKDYEDFQIQIFGE